MIHFRWPFTSAKRRARCARRTRGKDHLPAHLRPRVLRLEAAEPRLLLSHSAPELDSSLPAYINSIQQNEAIGSNSGETVAAVLASGGAVTSSLPLGSNFAFFDTGNGGQQGIAITALTGVSDGAWEYSTNNGQSWSLLDSVSTDDAERLAAGNELRFLPNEGFTGSASVSFAAWDLSDGAAAGTAVDLTLPGATGGGTAYSDTTATATLDVRPDMTIDPTALVNSLAAAPVAQAGNLSQQNLFTVGPDGLVRQDSYVDSPHADTGLAVIDPNTQFTTGANLTAYSDGNSVNVFGVDAAGQAVWNHYTAAGGWTGFVPLNTLASGADAGFVPGTALTATTEQGVLRLFAVATNGFINEYSYAAGSGAWTLADLSFLPSLPSATPLAVWDTGSLVNIFGVYANGTLETINFNYNSDSGSWGGVSGVGLSGTTPLAVSESGGDIDLFGVTTTGAIDHIYSSNDSTWYWYDISAGSDVFGSDAALSIDQYASGEFRLFGVNTSGAIKFVYSIDGGGWGSVTLGGTPAFNTSAGTSLYSDPSGVYQLFGLTTTGDVADEEYNGSGLWSEFTLGRSMDPTALVNSIPSTQIAQAGNLAEQDLFEVGADGLVREDRYDYGTGTDAGLTVIDPDTTFPTGTTPTTLAAYSDGTTTNVFGVASDGDVEWAQYSQGRGWTGFVPLNSFILGAGAVFSPGAPLAAAAQSGGFYLFGVATDGEVREYSYDSSTGAWTLSDPDDSVVFGANVPLAVWDNGSAVDLFGVVAGGSIEWLRESGGSWTVSSVPYNNDLAAATPLAISEGGSAIYLFGATSSGAVDEVDYAGGAWNSPSPIVEGSDTYAVGSALSINQYASGEFRLFGVNTQGAIKFVYSIDGGGWGSVTLGGTPAFNTSAGTSLYSGPSGVYQLFGLTTTGDIADEEYNGSGLWSEYALGRSMDPSALANSIVGAEVAQAGNLSQQNLFVVAGSGLVEQEQYVYSPHSFTVLTAIDTSTSFGANTNLTAYTDGTTINVFAVGRYGNAIWAQYTPGRGWTGFVPLNRFIPNASATFTPGAALVGVAQNGVFDLFGVGSDNYVEEYSYNSTTGVWSLTELNQSLGLPAFGAGTPLAVWDNGSSIDVFGVLSDGSIEWLRESGGTWTASNIPSDGRLAAATPLSVSEWGSTITLFGVTSAGSVDEMIYSGGAWQDSATPISVGTDTYAVGSAISVVQYASGEFRLFGVNTSGAIKFDYYAGGDSWGSVTLGGSPAFNTSVGTLLYSDASGVYQLFGLSTSGGILDEEYNGNGLWSEYSLS